MADIWAGTENALNSYLELKEVYLKKEVLDRGEKTENSRSFLIEEIGTGIMALNINGSLVNRKQWWHEYEVGSVTSYEEIISAVNQLRADQSVKKVIVGIDSGGGSAAGISDAAGALAVLSKEKEVLSYVNSAALSAGYWLAASTSKIVASKMAELGSIGVLAILENFSEAASKQGIKFHVIKAGEFKGIGFGGVELTVEDKKYLQDRVDKANNFFLTHVAESRNLSLADASEWGEARVFYAGEAKAVGLVDEVASIIEVMEGNTPATNKPKEVSNMTYEQKLAQIAAGVSPETILTAEELITFQAEDKTDPEGPEGLEDEIDPKELEDKTGQEGLEGKTDLPIEATSFSSQLMEMAVQLGEYKAENKQLAEKLRLAEDRVSILVSDSEALSVVAKTAVHKMQVALSMPKSEKESASDIVAQFNELQAKLSAKFPNTRKSSTTTDAVENKPRIPNPLNPNLPA